MIDFGLWSRDERSALRQAAADAGADVVISSFALPPTEQRRRLERRWAEAPHETWPVTERELDEWGAKMEVPTAAELDGSEPIDPPPAGFPTWADWIAHRWPPSVP